MASLFSFRELRTILLFVVVVLRTLPVLADDTPPCARIVSLAPSATETLFTLGLGPRVKGVTRYCSYPPEARDVEKVGGLFDINVERIVSLKPTDIFTLSEHRQIAQQLKALGFRVHTFDHRSVAGVMQSILEAGKACRIEGLAQGLHRSLQAQMEAVRAKTASSPPVRAMVVVGGEIGESGVTRVYLSGRDGFYSDLLKLAGGSNVYEGSTTGLPTLSREGILRLNPDVIIQIATDPGKEEGSDSPASLSRAWSGFPELAAVRNHKVFILHDYVDSIPGPRFVVVLQKIAALLHPELFGEGKMVPVSATPPERSVECQDGLSCETHSLNCKR